MNREQLKQANEIQKQLYGLEVSLPTFMEHEDTFSIAARACGKEAFDLFRSEYSKVLKERHAALVREFEAL